MFRGWTIWMIWPIRQLSWLRKSSVRCENCGAWTPEERRRFAMTTPQKPESPISHDALIAGLAVKATELEQAAEDLRVAYRFSRQLKVILVIGLVLMSVLVYNSFTNRATLRGVKQSNALILSCTDPKGACAKAGAASQASAVGQIIAAVNAHTDLVFIATIECSQNTPFKQKTFEDCMKSKGVAVTTGGN